MLAEPPEWCPNVAEVRDMAIAATLSMSLEAYRAAVAEGQTLCQIAETQGLNLDEAWVAAEGTREAIILQAVTDEVIIQAEADWLTEALTDPPEVCSGVTQVLGMAVAATLGVSLEDYRAAVADGLTLCQIAEAQGLDPAEVWAAKEGTRRAILQQAVKDELVTRSQADALSVPLTDHDLLDWCSGDDRLGYTEFLPLVLKNR
jgi:hypothetical protein